MRYLFVRCKAPAALLLLIALFGCADYDYQKSVEDISGLNLGGFSLPGSSFDLYRQEAYRGDVYLLYCRDNSFYDLNRQSLLSESHNVRIDPNGGKNLTANFDNSSLSPPLDFDITYTYYRMNSYDTNLKIDGLYNEFSKVFLVRIMDWHNDS